MPAPSCMVVFLGRMEVLLITWMVVPAGFDANGVVYQAICANCELGVNPPTAYSHYYRCLFNKQTRQRILQPCDW